MNIPFLSIITFLPLSGVILLLLLGNNITENGKRITRLIALVISLITLATSIVIAYKFNNNELIYGSFQFEEKHNWFIGFNIQYYLGIDAISLPFILLTSLLTPICILCSWHEINEKVKEYHILFLLLESLIFGTFLSLDIVLFYVFFEAVLIPMFIIIGVWGAENRVYAALKFFLYTLAGSVLFLFAIIFIYIKTGDTSIANLPVLLQQLPLETQKLLWLGFFLGFAIKIPMWPVHTWLPDAHVQAPTAGSVILAGILLKLGAYGFIRFSIAMLPDVSHIFKDYIFILGSIAIIYASFVAFAQTNMKKLIAYSSIAHMGYVTNGIFAMNIEAIQGSIVQMISHGLISAALFMGVGVLYERAHTKEIADFSGVAYKMPIFATIFMIFTLGSIGLPGTSGFVGELLSLLGLYKVNMYFTVISALGMVFGAMYMLSMYKRIMFGKTTTKFVKALTPLRWYENIAFLPLIVLILVLGIYPSWLTNLTESTLLSLIK